MLADRIAHRYATALFQLSVEKDCVKQVVDDFKSIEKIYDASQDFRILLRSPILTHEQKVPILKKIFEGRATPIISNFITILTKRSREALLIHVIKEFMAIYNVTQNITEAQLITAHLLDPVQKNDIETKLEKVLNTKIILKESIDPSLIGGFRVKIGSSLIDASVSNHLRQIRKKLTL